MRFGIRSGLFAAAALALVCSGPAGAADIPIPGKIAIVKGGKLFKLVAKPVGAFTIPAPLSGDDPTVGGGDVNAFDTNGSGAFDDNLTAGTWEGLGSPAGSKGYKYKNAAAPVGGPVKLIIMKTAVIKILAKDDETLGDQAISGSGNLGIELITGTEKRCAEFGGTEIKNETGLIKLKDAPPPGSCPVVVVIDPCPGCNFHSYLNFTVGSSSGDCGDIIDSAGMVVTNIACAGLYTGGGGNSVPLPYAIPDLGSPVSKITTCTGSVATIGAASLAETGSNNKCTAAGCRFGAPLAVPNPGSTPTSVCVLNTFSGAPSGTVDCASGSTNMVVPLSAVIFLTGDTSTDPGATIAGIQPCPLCTGGSCIGGPNNSMSCTAGTTTLGGNPAYPTSNDCPPDPMFNIGTLPVNFNVSTGTVVWSGTSATNDTGSTASVQNRVFSGFCRDADGTGAFAGSTPATAQLCWENGAAVGPACSGVFESCEQRNNGAFGPAGGANRTIRAIGSAASIIGGPAAGTLVGVFSIRPTFDATVDAAGDLPGPGAVALPGVAQTCATANPCP